MSIKLLSAAPVLEKLLPTLQTQAAALPAHLAIIQVGQDPASTLYIKRKLALAAEIGIEASHYHILNDSNNSDVSGLIETLNQDDVVTGIIVQLPLPASLNATALTSLIDPTKDVDGLTPHNIGRTCMSVDEEIFPPATPAGIITLLEHYDIPISGKHAVIVGRSVLVSKPLGMMLLNRDATVTYCHSKTNDLMNQTKQADILISATGRANLITGAHIKPGSTVIDVGIISGDSGVQGDIERHSVEIVAGALSPVPGGVGPMTVVSLMRNVLNATALQEANM